MLVKGFSEENSLNGDRVWKCGRFGRWVLTGKCRFVACTELRVTGIDNLMRRRPTNVLSRPNERGLLTGLPAAIANGSRIWIEFCSR